MSGIPGVIDDDGKIIDAETGDLIEVDNDGMKIDEKGNREVKMKEIIPAIYRYTEENYGITIVDDKGEIVARFDLDTERACNNWLNASEESKKLFVDETYNTYTKVNRITVETVNVNLNQIKQNSSDYNTMRDGLFTKLYTQRIDNSKDDKGKEVTDSSTIRRSPYCYWIGTMGWTAQRIDSDLSRNTCKV